MKTNFFVIVGMLVATSGFAVAQKPPTGLQDVDDGPVGIFESRTEYHDFMGMVKSNPALYEMVPMINDIVLGQEIGATGQKFGVNTSSIGLLADPKVREELEMADFQFEELEEMTAEIHERAAEELRSLDFSNTDGIADQIRQIQNQTVADLESLLLPHQRTRLQQVSAQRELRFRSLAEVLTSEPLRTDLEITDEQEDELKRTEEEIEAELERKIAELRADARDELLSVLKRDQQERVEEMFGDYFQFGQERRGNRK